MSLLLSSINPPRRRQNTVDAPTTNQPTGAHSESIPELKAYTADDDVPGTELDKDALVWKVYVQETDLADKEMCEDWNKYVFITYAS
ncbi:hypothetical protein FRC12_022912 [Ceratobasidium sp. 428]|nr:hypothetical protein FRC12_022912 [Ceratobasidium sp. 428]